MKYTSIRRVYLSVTGLCCMLASYSNVSGLETDITNYVMNMNAEIGVAVIIDGKDTVTVNNNNRYPLMSVFKLHQAMAVADRLHSQNINPRHNIFIHGEDMKKDTYSPLRDRFPEGNIRISVDELLDYTLKFSDNNACDALFKYVCNTKETDNYIRKLGLQKFSISETEEDMHTDLENCYKNWSTPIEMSKLIEILFTKDLDSGDFQNIIRQKLLSCSTGNSRLPFPLKNTGARLAHKTGTGDKNSKGAIIGINDAGMVFLPDGRRYAITVFVKDSYETFERTEKIIADISQMVFNYIQQQECNKNE